MKEIKSQAPVKMRYVLTLTNEEDETSMTDILKSRGGAGNPPPAKRWHINMNVIIIKSADWQNQIKDFSAQGAKKYQKEKNSKRSSSRN